MVREKVGAFLSRYGVTPDVIDIESLCDFIRAEMHKGLDGEESSLPMIPTYMSEGESVKSGSSVIVLDAGGTNFRTCLVTFDDDLKPVISDFRKVGMPGVKELVTAKEFFSCLADNVERLIDKSDCIGFCFSYAARINPDHDGIPLFFSKEVKAPEVIGKPIGKCLLEELASRGHDVSGKKVAVLNDTVATLLAAKAECHDHAGGYIGFILGTGTNTAYTEANAAISKIDYTRCGKQIINVESGNLSFDVGSLDKLYFQSTKDPDRYHFEKMISGAYLGPFAGFVIKSAIEEGLFSAEFAERFYKIGTLTTTVMSNYLEMPYNKDYALVAAVGDNEDDTLALYVIIDSIIERAAKLTAANLSAAVLQAGIGKNPREPAIINADGTTFYKTENLSTYTNYYLHELLVRRHHVYYKMVRIDDSPVLGAAIAGLSI